MSSERGTSVLPSLSGGERLHRKFLIADQYDEELMAKVPGDSFQEAYWKGPLISGETEWLGYPLIKSPFDLWVYQEIIYETKPEVIIETGTLAGGSALYLATILDAVWGGDYPHEKAKIYTIDINPLPGLPDHPRIVYYNGNSVSEKMVSKVHRVTEGKRTMLILDSDHSYEHVKAELEAYHDIVTPDCYLVVEDTWGELGYGAAQAKDEFVAAHPEFVVDHYRERHLMTFFPGGFLWRKPDA